MSRHPVTDHAVLRYLERVAGLNVETVRHNIHLKTKTALESGAKYITIDGYRYCLKGGHVITVLPTKKSRRLVAPRYGAWAKKGSKK